MLDASLIVMTLHSKKILNAMLKHETMSESMTSKSLSSLNCLIPTQISKAFGINLCLFTAITFIKDSKKLKVSSAIEMFEL